MKRNLTIFVAAAITLIAYLSAFTVHQTQQVLIVRVGEIQRVISEPGLAFKLPFIETAIYIDNRLLALDSPEFELITANQKRLVVDAFSRYHITDPQRFYTSTGGNVQSANIKMANFLNSAIRQVLGAESLVSVVRDNRAELMNKISRTFNEEAQDLGVTVEDVKIRRADLPAANSESVFNRMKSERQQEAAEHRATGAQLAKKIRAEAEKEATVLVANANQKANILRGEGDALKNKIFADAYGKDPEFFKFYRSMEAYDKGLNGDNTSLVLSPDSDFFSYFNNSRQ